MIRCKTSGRIYYNPVNGYTVAAYTTEEELSEGGVEKRNGTSTFQAIGYELPTSDGLEVELDGEWKETKHGIQYSVSYYQICMPTTLEGIEMYLSSNLIKGIGPVTAQRIVEKYGKNTFQILDNTPEKLLSVPGITESKLEEILDGYHESNTIRELMVYLAPLGVTPKKLAKIKDHFGVAAAKIVKEDPFRLCEVKGFGFLTVDPIASKSKDFKPNNPLRIKAGIRHVLKEAETEGHLFLKSTEIVAKAGKLLNHKLKVVAVTDSNIKFVGNQMIHEDRELVANAGGIYTRKSFEAEMGAAADLVKLSVQKNMSVSVEHLLERIQKKESIMLSKKQKEAVCAAFKHPVSVITGGPGRGKTTIIRFIILIQELLDMDGMILLCAPTGRASRRMYETTGYPAMTIHKAIGLVGDDEDAEWNVPQTLPDDLVIADESSMLDMYLAEKLFASIKKGARLILVGDRDQIESVGPGNVFKEIIESEVIPTTVLDECFRQEEDSTIVHNADRINENQARLVYDESFQFYPAKTPEEAAELIKEIYAREWKVQNKNVDAVQVLSPLRKDSKAGSDALNQILRDVANPKRRGYPEITNGGNTYRQGDKVMQMKNMDEVSNGDIGKVVGVFKKDSKEHLRVDYGDQRQMEYVGDDYWPLTYAYAMSVHKAQGNEYPIVIIPMLSCFYKMLRRNILYTAVTRGATKVILVGSKQAIAQAIKTNTKELRNTKLALHLRTIMDAMQKEQKTA